MVLSLSRLVRRVLPVLMVSVGLGAGCQPLDSSNNPAVSSSAKPLNDQSQTLTFPSVQPGPLAVAPGPTDAQATAAIQRYLSGLATQGYATNNQGVWMQSGKTLLANHQGTTPLPAASLTKVATSLAALQTFGADHRFETLIGTTGPIQNGVVKGDLVVVGSDDPFFVWEEAIAVGNLLSQMKIKQVTGSLIVVGRFFMNFEFDPAKSGELFKQAINAQAWSDEAKTQYQSMPVGTAKPQIAIAGAVQVVSSPPASFKPMLRHQSLPLAELLKKMNRYSNNAMAEIVASSVGGAKSVSLKAAQAAGVPQSEVLLVNGSGLAVENRISPRAVCSMFLAIERFLQPRKMTIADVFAVVGTDTGILETRNLPNRTVTKSGSLNAVSALAGAFPTTQKGIVWFVVMNGGGENLEGFRKEQEQLLTSLVGRWGAVNASPAELSSNRDRSKFTPLLDLVN